MSPKVRFSFYESVLGKCALVWGGEGVLRNFLPFESPSETQNEVFSAGPSRIIEPILGEKARALPELTSQAEINARGTSASFIDKLICSLELLRRSGTVGSFQQ